MKFFIAIFFFCGYLSFAQKHDIESELHILAKEGLLESSDIDNFTITSQSKSRISQARFYYFIQTYNSIEILGTESNMVFSADESLASKSINFIPKPNQRIQGRNHLKTPNEIISLLAEKMNYQINCPIEEISKNGNSYIFTNGEISKNDIQIEKVYYFDEENQIHPAWKLQITEIISPNRFNFIIDDTTGSILKKTNLLSTSSSQDENILNNPIGLKFENIQQQEFYSQAPINANSSSASYLVFELPLISPDFGPRTLVTNQEDILASPFGWHDSNGIPGAEYTITRGNNVSAVYLGNGSNPADGGSNLDFSFPLNLNYTEANPSGEASATNVFYWTNIFHDILFQYGFDEEAGNFQATNYTGLGIDDDEIRARSQASNFFACNGTVVHSEDGESAEITTYLCENNDIAYDSQTIVGLNAWAMAERLSGGSSTIGCLFSLENTSIGLNDWYGLMLTLTANDVETDLKAYGNWTTNQDSTDLGARIFPYTTDMEINPLTYDSIKTQDDFYEVGTTWASILWEVTWALINEYGFDSNFYNGTGGNNVALALVTEALKIQPCGPGFIDARDAIFTADQLLYNGQNFCLLWEAFAKRGLGLEAQQGSALDKTDGTESFLSYNSAFFDEDYTVFCISEAGLNLSGGYPGGGIYSGPGVTDNGDGTTYSFDPSAAGLGVHTITYTISSLCPSSQNAVKTIEVKDDNPVIECRDIDLLLDENGNASIQPQDVIENFIYGENYTIDQNGTFNPEDISNSGTSIYLGYDFNVYSSQELPIGFNFNFFGQTYSTFRIYGGGFINFASALPNSFYSTEQIPDNSLPNNLIAYAWSNIDPSQGGQIRYKTIGNAPNRILIIDFDGLSIFSEESTTDITTQIKLFERDSKIELHSTNLNVLSATQGIENADGTSAYFIPGRNKADFDVNNDYLAFIPNPVGFPDNCGTSTIVALNTSTFDCDNLGENVVTATMTDDNGNSSSCNAIVTIITNETPNLELSNSKICLNPNSPTILSGGFPIGGAYSGPGVTDLGDGNTFSIDSSLIGEGVFDISYTTLDSCGNLSTVISQIEVVPSLPEIQCKNISIELDENGFASILPGEIGVKNNFTNNPKIYGIDASNLINNVSEFQLDLDSNTLNFIENNEIDNSSDINFTSIENNPVSGKIYLLGSSDNDEMVNLYELNLENYSYQFIDTLTSFNGNTLARSIAFDSTGEMYIIFSNGEINIYNPDNQNISVFTSIPDYDDFELYYELTYDFEHDKIIVASPSNFIRIWEIDVDSTQVDFIFSSLVPFDDNCTGSSITYAGKDKLIFSGGLFCTYTYILNLITNEFLEIPFVGNFDDYMIIGNLPRGNCNQEILNYSLSQEVFDCSNLGENDVVLSLSDSFGNTSSCSTTVTILDNFNDTILDCKTEYSLSLDSTGSAQLDYETLLLTIPPETTSICNDDDIQFVLSQNTFSCNDYNSTTEINIISNGSFEYDTDSWISTFENGQISGACSSPWQKLEDSTSLCSNLPDIFPTQGNLAFFTSFSNGDVIQFILQQTFTISEHFKVDELAMLSFDWIAEFEQNNSTFFSKSLDVELYDSNNNLIQVIYTENINPSTSISINESLNFDLSTVLVNYIGQDLTLKFRATIPPSNNSLSKAMIDNVELITKTSTKEITLDATNTSGVLESCSISLFLSDPNNVCLLSSFEFELNDNFIVYPNPSSQQISINWSNMTLENVQIFDINGKLVIYKNINQGLIETEIDLTELSSGVYILKANSNLGTIARKLIKE